MTKPSLTSAADNAGKTTVIAIRAQPIELCQLLKFAGLAESGGQAKEVISEGKVSLNGVIETQKRKKILAGDRVTLGDETLIVKIAGS